MKKFPSPQDYNTQHLYQKFLNNREPMVAIPNEQKVNLPTKLVTSIDCVKKYGDPVKERNMVLWEVPSELQIDAVPKRIYCNKDLVKPLGQAFFNLKESGYDKELLTWDGCFNIRSKKGGTTYSLHSWAIAIDANAAWNGMGNTPTLSQGFVNCFKAAGFHWGGDWRTPDGMHFQLAII